MKIILFNEIFNSKQAVAQIAFKIKSEINNFNKHDYIVIFIDFYSVCFYVHN